MQGNNTMTPARMGRLFRRHYGESALLARRLGVHRATISRWFKGEVTSARIGAAALRRAKQFSR